MLVLYGDGFSVGDLVRQHVDLMVMVAFLSISLPSRCLYW